LHNEILDLQNFAGELFDNDVSSQQLLKSALAQVFPLLLKDFEGDSIAKELMSVNPVWRSRSRTPIFLGRQVVEVGRQE